MGLFTDGNKRLIFDTLEDAVAASQQIHANIARKAAAEGWLYHKDTGAVLTAIDLPADDADIQPMLYPLVAIKKGAPMTFPDGVSLGFEGPWQRATDGKFVIRKVVDTLMTNVGGNIETFGLSWEEV